MHLLVRQTRGAMNRYLEQGFISVVTVSSYSRPAAVIFGLIVTQILILIDNFITIERISIVV